MDLRIDLIENVVFVGGNTKLRNFRYRVMSDFEEMWNTKSQAKSKVKGLVCVNKDADDPSTLAYKGIHMLSQVITKDNYVSKNEYEECGAIGAVYRKNINKLRF